MKGNLKENDKLQRPPVVVVVGHVDHGKTSLLDYIRKTTVASREAGGITQSVGAYEVIHNGQKITFIDTPGHEAFIKMRSRGADIADLAILVVAADEGVKPQTEESIKILNESKTPFVVAITKMDKQSANLDKVRNELMSHNVLLEGYGGEVGYEPVSVVSGEGINKLLDFILLLAEVTGLSWSKSDRASGFVLEAFKDSRRGTTAHLILKDGVLREGDDITTKTASGKVKTLENFLKVRSKELEPSAPAAVLGFETPPQVGEEFWAGNVNIAEIKIDLVGKDVALPSEGEKKMAAVFRADTSGSLEVLNYVLNDMLTVKDSAVGEITDNDIQLAISTGSIVLGFRVGITKSAENLARVHSVKVLTSEIIYELQDGVKKLLKEAKGIQVDGEMRILKVFGEAEGRQIIGGRVLNGFIKANADIQINRNEKILGDGRIINLQENRKDIAEVGEGKECGLLVESDVKISSGDILKILAIE